MNPGAEGEYRDGGEGRPSAGRRAEVVLVQVWAAGLEFQCVWWRTTLCLDGSEYIILSSSLETLTGSLVRGSLSVTMCKRWAYIARDQLAAASASTTRLFATVRQLTRLLYALLFFPPRYPSCRQPRLPAAALFRPLRHDGHRCPCAPSSRRSSREGLVPGGGSGNDGRPNGASPCRASKQGLQRFHEIPPVAAAREGGQNA